MGNLRLGLARASARARRGISLRMKLVLPLILLAAVAATLVAGVLARHTAEGYRRGYQQEGRALARSVAIDLAFRGREVRIVEELAVRIVKATPSVYAVRVYLFSEGGPATWVSTLSGETGTLSPDPALLRRPRGTQREVLVLGEDVLETVQPFHSGEAEGAVAVYTSLRPLHDRIAHHQRMLALVIGVAALLSALAGALLLQRQVLRPVGRLSRAAARVAAGDLSVRLPQGGEPEGRDQLANLGREMDHMIRAVDLRGRQQASVAELGRLVMSGADLDALLGRAVALLAVHLGVEYAGAVERLGDGQALVVRAAHGFRPGTIGAPIPSGRSSQSGYTLEIGGPVVMGDVEEETRFSTSAALRAHGVRSGVSVVVPGREGPWGILGAHTTERRTFGPDDILFFEVLANTLGQAIEDRRAQEHLSRAEARYRQLVERVPAITYIAEFGEAGRWSFVSPQIESMLGYTPEEWMSQPGLWYGCLHPDDRAAAMEEEALSLERGEPLSAEYRLIGRNGRVTWIRDEALVQPGEDGKPVLNGIMYDVTGQRQAEEAEQEARARFQTLVEQVPAVVYADAVDDQSTALYMSPRVEALTGYTMSEWVATPDLWRDSVHPEDRDRVMELSQRTNQTGEPFRAEYRLRRRDGSYRWVQDEAMLIHSDDGRPLHWQGIFYDVTERRQAEEALRSHLEHEREAADRLRAIDEMKNAFLAAVSHELRTPLSSVLGYAVTLERPDLDVSEDERRDMTQRLAVNARKLERLLSDLLDLDRLARGVLEPQRRPTELAQLVERVIRETELRGREIDITVRPLVAEVDAPKVERIVENLVANAVKHTAPEAHIWLSVDRHEDGVMVQVEDDGPGIPDTLKALVFEPFRQGEPQRGPVPGTGIGLSLVTRFAELHGGRAWVEDRSGGGASFRVYLPCPVVQGARAAAG